MYQVAFLVFWVSARWVGVSNDGQSLQPLYILTFCCWIPWGQLSASCRDCPLSCSMIEVWPASSQIWLSCPCSPPARHLVLLLCRCSRGQRPQPFKTWLSRWRRSVPKSLSTSLSPILCSPAASRRVVVFEAGGHPLITCSSKFPCLLTKFKFWFRRIATPR